MISSRLKPAFPLLVLLTTAASVLPAQNAGPVPAVAPRVPAREGLWFSGGLGSGVGEGGWGGLTGNFAVGWALNQRLSLAVGSSDFRIPLEGEALIIGTLDVRALFYPEANAGFFLTGGLGLGFFTGESHLSRGDVGRGLVLGLGYDARVARNTSVTTFINWVNVHTPDPRVSALQFGVGVTFH
jgi:hypothetical protein